MPPTFRPLRCWFRKFARALVCACLVLASCPVLPAQSVGSYIVTTTAGLGPYGSLGDGGPALSASLQNPTAITVDRSGNIFVFDTGDFRVRKITPQGIITTVAGNGTQGFSGDNGPATSAQLGNSPHYPTELAVDASGNLFIPDGGNNRVREVTPQGIITTVAGNGTGGFSGDNGPATSAQLYLPTGVALDAAGNLFIADTTRIRKVTPQGIITTVAGSSWGLSTGDGGPATSATFQCPWGIALDPAGDIFIADNSRIRKVTPQGIITTVAGGGLSGDNGPATSAQLGPTGVALDAAGNLLIVDGSNNRVREVTPQGIITTIAGGGGNGFPFGSSDGEPATSYSLNPTGIAVDASGNVLIGDGNNKIRKLVPSANSAVGCTYSIDQSDQSFGAVGGANSVGVLASGASCPWLAGSYVSWITVNGSGNQSGSGVVTYTVSSNSTSVTRSGTIWAAGQTLTVNQAGGACSSNVSPLSVAVPGSGVTGANLTVTSTASDCQWTAGANAAWILVSGGSTGSGNGTVTFTVGVNTGAARTGTITVAGQAVQINQAASGGATANITVTPSSLDLGTYQMGGANPSPGTVSVSGGGQSLGFMAQVTNGSNWLSVSPTSGTTPTAGSIALTVTAAPGNLGAGSYSGTILVSGTGTATGSISVTVSLTVTASLGPLPTIKGVTNAASYATGAVSPGELVTLFGTGIGPATAASAITDPSTGKLATTIGGVQVLFNGSAAPMIYAGSTQVSAVVPYEMAPVVSPSVWIKYAGQASNAFQLTTATTAPGLFTQNASGSGPGAILNQDNSLNGPGNRAAKGSIVQVYLTGEGQTSPPSVTGAITSATFPPPQVTPAPLLAVGVTINGQPALYVYAGEAPSLVAGMMQLNVQIPANAPSGDLAILVSIGGHTSQNGVTVSVQ